MTKTRFIAILSVGILGFGLVSCSKDTEIKYQQDNYQPRDILVEKADKSFTALNNLSSMDFSRHLVINEDSTAPENQIKNLVLSTSCRSQSSQVSSTHLSNWPNPTTIKILDILPTDILLQRDGETIFCDITYTSTNAFNSTNTGKVNQLKIQNLNSFSNLDNNHVFSQDVVSWVLVKDKVINPLHDSTGTIVCTDIAYTQTRLGMVTLEQFLTADTLQQSKPKTSEQICRALFRTEDNVALSKVFKLELPIIPPTITYSFSARQDESSIMDWNKTVTFKVMNPNSFPVPLKMDLRSRVLHFRAFYGGKSPFSMGPINELPLDYFWNNEAVDPEKFDVVKIAPGNSTSQLVGAVRGRMDCNAVYVNKKGGYFNGFNLDLNMDIPFVIQRSSTSVLQVPYHYTGSTLSYTSHLKGWDIFGFTDPQWAIDRIGSETNQGCKVF